MQTNKTFSSNGPRPYTSLARSGGGEQQHARPAECDARECVGEHPTDGDCQVREACRKKKWDAQMYAAPAGDERAARPVRTSEKITTGLKWAPESGTNTKISTVKPVVSRVDSVPVIVVRRESPVTDSSPVALRISPLPLGTTWGFETKRSSSCVINPCGE